LEVFLDNGQGEVVKSLINHYWKDSLDELLRLEIVKNLISLGANDLNDALYGASTCGRLEIVKYLISLGANGLNGALSRASDYGRLEVVEYLNTFISHKNSKST
jgi:hypothetical protein